MKTQSLILSMFCSLIGTGLSANILPNSNFSLGTGGLEGWSAWANVSHPTTGSFGSGWGLADLPVIASAGSATFGVNSQLPLADSNWVGGRMEANLYHDFLTFHIDPVAPNNNLFGQTIRFSGNAVISQAYDAGNTGQIFIKMLDASWGMREDLSVFVDISTLNPDGAFELTAAVPADVVLNTIQVGFVNDALMSTAGAMTISNLSVTVVPEPGTYALLLGCFALGAISLRNRRKKS